MEGLFVFKAFLQILFSGSTFGKANFQNNEFSLNFILKISLKNSFQINDKQAHEPYLIIQNKILIKIHLIFAKIITFRG
jgi:hypothetical protein